MNGYLFSNQDLKRLIVPLILEQFFQAFVGLADSIMVASVGEAAVSGVSLVDTVMVPIINIFAALGTGGAVIAGQYLGKKQNESGCIATGQLVLSVACLSVFIMALCYACKGFILHVVFGKIEADVMRSANIYLLIVFASIPFIALYNAGAAIFRAMSNSKVTLKITTIMNVINIVGNAVLIFGFHCGTEGVAIPTLVSRMVACFIIMALLTNQAHTLHIPKPFSFRPNWGMLRKILHIGVPNGLENSMFQVGKIVVLSLVAGFGTASITANAIANNISMFSALPGMAIGFALLTVISRCVGAGDYEQAKYYTKKLMKITYAALFVMNLVVVLLIPVILNIYGVSTLTRTYTTQILVFYCISTVFIWAPSFSLPNVLRAANDVRFSMIISIISMWVFRVAFSYLLGDTFGMGVFGVWVAMVIDWLFRAICFVARYLRGKWQLQKI